MAGKNRGSGQPHARLRAPAPDPAAREQQLISMAMDRAEQKFLDGTASDSLTIHFLRLATTRAELEKKKIEHEILKMNAQTDAIESASRIEELYAKAMDSMRHYGASINSEYSEEVK